MINVDSISPMVALQCKNYGMRKSHVDREGEIDIPHC